MLFEDVRNSLNRFVQATHAIVTHSTPGWGDPFPQPLREFLALAELTAKP